MLTIRIEVEVRPTEDESKVRKALKNIFTLKDSDIKGVDIGNNYKLLVVESRKLTVLFRLYELLRQERILDTARSIMLSLKRGDMLTLKLHKQSAYAGHISFISYDEESPLGPIVLTIVSDKLSEIIDWLAPKTSHGRPLWEKEIPRV
ncbi:MAG: hypothetical protein B6U85_02455 [Desulfurococcales archaeon ex4484_42]|nr:MAG: hypothetical protein B6U85_02455 [Desulfurococcales archaeon ex4484_42]